MKTMNHSDYGQIIEPGVIRFKKVLPGPAERVWAYLTESEKRRKWLASGKTELEPGGLVHFHFLHEELSDNDIPIPEKYRSMQNGHSFTGRVIEVDPPRLLRYAWSEDPPEGSEVTFELNPQGDKIELTLTHRKLPQGMMTSVACGWHTHLGILVDVLENRPPKGFWSVHQEVEDIYREKLQAQPRQDANEN